MTRRNPRGWWTISPNVNQNGDVLAAKNIATRYSGNTTHWTAAMTSSIAAASSGHDGQIWTIVN